MAIEATIGDPSIVNQLEIFRKSLEGLVAKLAAGAHVLHPVALVEGHIKPFYLEARAGHWDVTRG